uniref:MORN repeat-containing protein 3 n=1 Tax=Globisporangium ultimum (strain ATCC 200006 / CBS 805.95 / DAOM BR144) TaxID=431595 RepID=K3WS49_GLOUD
MHTARLSSNTGTPSRLSEKLANRNGPRHSVYWVQTKKASDMRLPTHSNVLDATNMGDASAKVEYTLVGKYTGDWKDGVKHGYGVLIYANGNKYEGEWVEGKREGKGVYWIHDKKHKKLRKQFAGDWQRDQRHGLGTFFHEDGSRYEGFWANNKREGDGRMLYGSDRSVYEGQWSGNVRSGRGTLTLVNGDIYDGYWLNDKKEGPGRFYYKATRKMYEGEWVDGAPKCGTYHDNYDHDDDDARHAFGDDDGDGSSALRRHHRFELPEVSFSLEW